MKNNLIVPILLLVSSLSIISCTDKNSLNDDIENPINYDFLRDGTSTVSFSGQTIRIGMATELINAMTDFDQSSEALIEMYTNQTANGAAADPFENIDYNESIKSVKSKVAASADFFSTNTSASAIIRADLASWIQSQVSEVFPNKNILAMPGIAGQIADGTSVRYVNGKGLEYNQAVNKSLIGALMIDQICNNYLSDGVLDAGDNVTDNEAGITVEGNSYTNMEHKWDEAYGYLFGAATDSKDPLATLGEDSFLNKYLSSVDSDDEFAGIASDVFEAFKLGRAAIVAGNYNVRDQQIVILKEKLASVIAIRAVYYLQKGKLALSNGEYGGAFHDLSEGFGFVYSLRFVSQPNNKNPYFTTTEVSSFLDNMTAGNGFWDIEAATLDQISTSIASEFDFTVAQAAQ